MKLKDILDLLVPQARIALEVTNVMCDGKEGRYTIFRNKKENVCENLLESELVPPIYVNGGEFYISIKLKP